MEKKRYLECGKIVNTHGIRGEVKIQPWCDSPEFLKKFKTLYIDGAAKRVLSARVHKDCLIVLFDGVADVNDAMRLKNKVVLLDREDAKLPKGSYFIQDILGLPVYDEEKGELPKLLSLKSIDQIIVIGEVGNAYLRSVVRTGIGCILFDFENEDFDMDAVISDNVNGGYLLTRHLVRSGCKKIGFVGSYLATRSNLDRFVGYRKYLIANQLDFNEEYVLPDRDEKGLDVDLKLPATLPDGFICTNDHTAYRLIKKLRSEGYNVPEDIAVVGYDDYSDNRMDDVALTTYHVNIEEMINQLLNILEQHCINPDYRYGTVISYGWLVERKTGLLGAGKNKGE